MLSFSNYDIANWKTHCITHPKKRKVLSTYSVEMTPAQARTDLVPISKRLAKNLMSMFYMPKDTSKRDKKMASLYSTLSRGKKTGTIPRATAAKILAVAEKSDKSTEDWLDFEIWQGLVKATDVTWDQVESVEKTEIPETGYDLTVPGYETFMDVDGVILSNTMSFHVPVSPRAVEEAKEKMLPSRNLLNVANFNVHYTPSMEYLLGLYKASKNKKRGSPVYFKSKQDVVDAFNRGDITIDTPIVIK